MSENLNKQFSPVRVVETLSDATKTLDVYDTGKIFMLDRAAGIAITMPAATADDMSGWHVTLVIKTALASGDVTIAPPTADDTIIGLSTCSDGSAGSNVYNAAGDIVTIDQSEGGGTLGEKVEIFCDGTNFYAHCLSEADGGITITG